MTVPSALTHPLPDLASWTRHFLAADIPVLPDTAMVLEALRENEDAADANMLGEALAGDPLISLKVLAHVAANRSPRLVTDAETVTSALVLMGITPFFRAFTAQETVDSRLASQPDALRGLHAVLRRAHRASQFALGIAVHRGDYDAAVIHEAALLHDFADMLLWCHAPSLALDISRRLASDSTLRSAAAQRDLLNIELADLQQSLMAAWRLPELLVRLSDDRLHAQPQVRNVLLAIRLSRHTAESWDNAAVPDDIRDIAALLNMNEQATLEMLLAIDN